MATFTVTTAADVLNAGDSELSLREAVFRANTTETADTIVFAGALEGRTLTLTFGQLTLEQDVTIDGDRDDNGSRVTLDGDENGRVLAIAGDAYAGTDARLADLVITGGYFPGDRNGGGILLGAGNNSLTLTDCTVRGNGAGYAQGGGISAEAGSHLTVARSTIEDNGAAAGGGIAATGGARVVVTDSRVLDNGFNGGGGFLLNDGASLLLTRSLVSGNNAALAEGNLNGGGILAADGARVEIVASTISDNFGELGGGIAIFGSTLLVSRSTIAGNQASGGGFSGVAGDGGAIAAFGSVVHLDACTVTGNQAGPYSGTTGGIALTSSELRLADTIVAGNFGSVYGSDTRPAADIDGAITASNGHNVFGSAVAGEAEGDRENVAAARLFAALDPDTGGGRLSLNGGPTPTVRLRDAPDNPALSGADPLTAGATDQRGFERLQPEFSNPDIGSFELAQRALSTRPSANNDVLTGTAGADALGALAGNDLVRGLAGPDALRGLAGSDTLDGGDGSDQVDGGAGTDLLRGGAGDDRLYGGSGGDRLFAGPGDDLLRGGAGADRLFGGAGVDRFDLDPGDGGVGAGRRDRIEDFAPGPDSIDLRSIDANAAAPGDQAFRFVGDDALTGAGQLRFAFAGTTTLVQGSNDRDVAPEFEIQLAGTVGLAAADFLL